MQYARALRTIPPLRVIVSSTRRGIANIASPQTQTHDIRNIALMAHIDSGKTTLTESILHTSQYLMTPGTVDTGSTTTDFLPAERERGITIQSASIPVKWKHWTFNLIDTPGHVDFGMEVESASRVIDGAVVLMDAVEGVEGQTLGVWRQLDRHDVPTRMIFLNKLDRPGASLRSSLQSILENRLHPRPTLLTLPISSFSSANYASGEPGITGLVDLVNWEIWKWTPGNPTPTRHPLPRKTAELESYPLFTEGEGNSKHPHPIRTELVGAREALIDTICVHSPAFFEHFMSLSSPTPYLEVEAKEMLAALRALVLERAILPVLCGAALRHIGTELTLNFAGELLASPFDVIGRESGEKKDDVSAGKEGKGAKGAKVLAAPSVTSVSKPGEVQMLAWKVGWDKQKGWMTFVRVYSGTLTRQTVLYNTSSHQRERISKLVLLYASESEVVESLPFGSVGVILGLKHTRTGDTLVSTSWSSLSNLTASSSSLRSIVPPPSVISAAVIPHAQSDVGPVKDALLALSRTDPSLRVSEDENEGQTLVHGLGALHLEIVEGRLKDEWGVRCVFGKRRVSYRETLVSGGEPVEGAERLERDMGGRRVGANVEVSVRALAEGEEGDESWDGNVVLGVDGKTLVAPSGAVTASGPDADSPQARLAQGVQNALAASPHTALPLTRVHVSITRADLDDSSPPVILSSASTAALRRALKDGGSQERGGVLVMEPYMRVKVDVAEDVIGKVVSDLTEHGGEILDLEAAAQGDEDSVGGYSGAEIYLPPAILSPSSAVSLLEGGGGMVQMKGTVHAVAPLSDMLDYSSRLRASSGGMGTFEMSVEGFRAVGEERKLEILREVGRI